MKAGRSFLVSAAASISLRLPLIRAMSSNALHPPSVRTTTGVSSDATKPTLRGVVFDMDGTLTKPNLDFAEMYRRCGVDPAHDILEQIAKLPSAEEQEGKLAIIEEMEEEGRRTLELVPGAMELISWLDSHEIPMAIVTRNTRRTTDVLINDILPPSLGKHFHPMITRDDEYPPKPDPAAMQAIMKEWSANDRPAPESSSFLMVGDSVANDIGFGNQAGATTALLDSGRRYQEEQQGKTASIDDTILKPDFVVDCLWQLSRQLWFHFHIDGKLGTTLQRLPKVPAPKEPETELGIAATNGDLFLVRNILEKVGADVNGIDESGNTALIWATECNQVQMVQLLAGTENINLNHRGFLRATALCRAARRGYGTSRHLFSWH